MHVLILPSRFDTVDEPAAGAPARDAALALSRAGLQTGIAFVERRRLSRANPFSFLGSHFQTLLSDDDGVPLLRTKAWNAGERLWRRLTLRLIDRYVSTFGRPDLVHADGAPAERVARTLGLPVVTDPMLVVDTDYFTPRIPRRTTDKIVRERDLAELPRWHMREWLRDARAVVVSSGASVVAMRAMATGAAIVRGHDRWHDGDPDAVRAAAVQRFGYDAFVKTIFPVYAKALVRPNDISLPILRSVEPRRVRDVSSAAEPRVWR